MTEKESHTPLIIGTIYKSTQEGLSIYPLINTGDGNYRQKNAVQIDTAGLPIGEYLGTDSQVREQMNTSGDIVFIRAYDCLLFIPTEDCIQILDLPSQVQDVLIALTPGSEHFLEPV